MNKFLRILNTLLVTSNLYAQNPNCAVLFETAGNEGTGKARFEAAVDLKENGTGVSLGNSFNIPKEDIQGLTAAFQKDYTDAGSTKGASPAAGGNVGHMQDHFDFVNQQGDKFQKALGIETDSLKLAVAAHDIGKGFLDPVLAAYIKEKGDSYGATSGDKSFIPFLHNFILSHEEHSIARIPEVVGKYLENKGVDTKSPEGKKKVLDYSAQIIESIRQHNGVDVTGDLKAKYASLAPEEIQSVVNAWWAQNYQTYAKAMGLSKTQYGGETNLIGETLNFIDRATLTTKSAPQKLMLQGLGNSSWGMQVVRNATVLAAEGNIPLIKAQGDKLKKYLLEGDAEKLQALNQVIQAADKQNRDMIALGKNLEFMNDADILNGLGISPEEGTLVYMRKDGQKIRINGKDKANAFVEVWNDSKRAFETAPDQVKNQSPVTILMSELAKDGRW